MSRWGCLLLSMLSVGLFIDLEAWCAFTLINVAFPLHLVLRTQVKIFAFGNIFKASRLHVSLRRDNILPTPITNTVVEITLSKYDVNRHYIKSAAQGYSGWLSDQIPTKFLIF